MIHSLSLPPRTATRRTLRWLVSFAGFPLGGLAAMTLVGPVDRPVAAAAGGLLSGAVLGATQAWALGIQRRTAIRWTVVTALGLAAGLALGATLVGFRTGMADLVVQGALSGAAVGLAQASVLTAGPRGLALAWPGWLAVAWGAGWAVTTAIGVQVDEQFTVFGSAGAVTVAALTAVLPRALAARTVPASATVGVR